MEPIAAIGCARDLYVDVMAPTVATRELSGRELADAIRGDVSRRVATLVGKTGDAPKLAILSATDDASSAWYVGTLARGAERVGLGCELAELGPDAGMASCVRKPA